MATTYRELLPERATFRSTAFPSLSRVDGTSIPVFGLAFDPSNIQEAFWSFVLRRYGSGNVTLDIYWYAATASTGQVRWGAALAAITPNTDTQDVTTKALATETAVNASHLGTVGKRLHRTTITLTNLDSLANGDRASLRLRRIANDVTNDTMSGYAVVIGAELSYSDV